MDREARAARRLGLLLWFRLARAYGQNLRAAAAHLRRWDLTAAQFDVLAQVGAAEGITQGELARRLFVTQGNVAQLVARLEARGLLQREREGRVKRLRLTPAGRRLYSEVVPEQERLQAAQFEALSLEERRRLLALLRKLERARRSPPPASGGRGAARERSRGPWSS
ncbi:MAG: MarR family transcriptional regulator [Firmicutes bacterium]|nr:MarR family transcriptional regulator [Bacillota bacterium]